MKDHEFFVNKFRLLHLRTETKSKSRRILLTSKGQGQIFKDDIQ
jgi:hypothetical protein